MAVNRHDARRAADKYIRQGKVENAIQQLVIILQEVPDDANTLNLVGDLYAKIGKKPEAFKYYSQLADKYARDGFFLKAIAIYKKVNRIDPSQIEIYYKLGDLYNQQGLKNDAKAQYGLVCDYLLQKNERMKAIDAIKKILELEPGNLKYRSLLADVYTKEGLSHQATQEHFSIAQALMSRGMHDDAIKVLHKAHGLDEVDTKISVALAGAHLSKGQASEAAAVIQKALARSPEDPALLKMASEVHISEGRVKDARAHLETLSRLTPDDTGVQRKLKEISTSALPAGAGPKADMAGVDLTLEDLDHVSGEWADSDLKSEVQSFLGAAVDDDAFSFAPPPGGEADREREEFVNEHMTEADVFLRYGLTDKAIDQLEAIVSHYPDNLEVLKKLKTIYAERGEIDAAVAKIHAMVEVYNKKGDRAAAANLEAEARTLASASAAGVSKAAKKESSAGFSIELPGDGNGAEADEEITVDVPPGETDAGFDIAADEAGKGGFNIASAAGDSAGFDIQVAKPAAQPSPKKGTAAFHLAETVAIPSSANRAVAAKPADDEEMSFTLEDEGLTAPTPVRARTEPEESEEFEIQVDADGPVQDEEDEYQLKEITGHGNQPIPRELMGPIHDIPDIPRRKPKEEDVEFSMDEEGVEFFDSALKAPKKGAAGQTARASHPTAAAAVSVAAVGGDEVLSADETEVFDEEHEFMDLASSLDKEMAAMQSPKGAPERAVEEPSSDERSIDSIFREFKKGVDEQLGAQDLETHYNLGIAYKEMGLLEEAIGEFQVASKAPSHLVRSCSLLGLCFRDKGMPKLAIQWYQRGIDASGDDEHAHIELLYELGITLEESGELDQALETFSDVYGLNSDYREVADKIQAIEEILKA